MSRYGLPLAAIIVLCVGLWQTQRFAQNAEAALRNKLMRQASMIAETVSPEQLSHLSFSPEDRNRPVFQRLNAQMAAASEHLGLSGVYSLTRRGGSYLFGPESYPEGHPSASQPGTRYRKPPPELESAFTLCKPQTTRLYSDEYGRFASAFAPIRASRADGAALVIGIDLSADDWNNALAQARRGPLLVTLILLSILLAGELALKHHHRLSEQIHLRLHYAETILCAIIMLALTAAATWYVSTAERHTLRATFTALAQAEIANISRDLHNIHNRLDDIRRFFLACDKVDKEEFRLFTERLNQSGLTQAYLWAPAIPADETAALKRIAPHQSAENFSVWEFDSHGNRVPAAPRPMRYPVLYAEPHEANLAMQGFDLASVPARREAIEKARREELNVATDPTPLYSFEGCPQGLFFLAPVETPFHNGVVASSVCLRTLLRHASHGEAGDTPEGLFTALFQLDPGRPPRHLVSSCHNNDATHADCWTLSKSALRIRVPLFVFDKAYAIAIYPSPGWLARHPLREGLITAIAGLLITCLMTALVAFLSNRRTVLEREIGNRTADLRQMNANVRAVFNAAPTAMLVANADALIVDMNHAAHKFLPSISPNILTKRRLGNLIGCTHQADSGYDCGHSPFCPICPLNQAMQDVLAGKPGVNDHDISIVVNRSGKAEELWVRFSVEPVCFDNAPHALIALHEITAWHRSDEALIHERNLLYALMDSLPDRIYFKDKTLHYIKVSKAHASALGLASPHEAIGKTDADFMPPDEAERRREREAHIIATGQPLIAQVEQRQTEDGTTRWISASKVPIRDKTGDIIGLVCISRDISFEIELQQQLQQTSKMDAIGRLAGGVAHDFNNLLQAILGFTELLLIGVNEKDAQYEDLKQIERAAKRATDLTRQLLTFSRKQRIDPQLVDLNQLITSTEKMLSRLMGEDIQITLNLKNDLKAILADPNQIEQIIINLAVNARDAMPQGGNLTFHTSAVAIADIDTQLIPESIPGEFICLSVSDTGVGIGKQYLPHLFEPFFTTKAQGKGTGLGLAVIYGIVKQAGGWINVYSEEGNGATFKIYLPAQQSEVSETHRTEPQTSLTLSLPGLGKSILLVEDEPGIRSLATLILQSAGYRVVACESAAEALSVFDRQKGRFDLLFSDIVLGGKNGIELACELRAKRPGLPVLLSSGYADERVRWEQIEQEGFRFLAKPYPSQKLLLALGETLAEKPTQPHQSA